MLLIIHENEEDNMIFTLGNVLLMFPDMPQIVPTTLISKCQFLEKTTREKMLSIIETYFFKNQPKDVEPASVFASYKPKVTKKPSNPPPKQKPPKSEHTPTTSREERDESQIEQVKMDDIIGNIDLSDLS